MTSPNVPLYNANTPQNPSETLDDSQLQLQTNFFELARNFRKNHVALDANTPSGNHTIIQLLEQPPNSGIQTDPAEISIFTQHVEGQTDQLFLEYQGNSPTFQYSNYQLYKPLDNEFQEKYFTFLPGKIIMYFGIIRPNQKANLLDLSPYISRNIISISLCPLAVGTNSFFKPNVELPEKKDGIYQGITINRSGTPSAGGLTPISNGIPACYYMVMANV